MKSPIVIVALNWMSGIHIKNRSLIFVIFAFILSNFPLTSSAQKKAKTATVQYRADIVEVAKSIGKGALRLLDNVEFIHEGVKMYCDSAYFYQKKNSLDAFNNIFINQGDTLFLYGDFLHYDGNKKLATITGEVKLVNRETTLTTNRLDYNLHDGIAYYKDHGHTVNKETDVVSTKGFYKTRLKTIILNDSVKITNPDYQLFSDTVEYNTETEVALFFGPTNILGDSSHIYGEKGWYDTEKKISEIEKNAWVKNKTQTIVAEYIHYNKSTGEGSARDNVSILEEKHNILLLGNKAIYNDSTQYSFLTDSARFIQFTSDGDSLYLHADSLISYPDSNGSKMIFAYYNVRFFRENVQGKCDSLVYTFSDSTTRMYYAPVLWTGVNQVSSKVIEIVTKNQKMDKMFLTEDSFICSQKDTNAYDQVKGKNMTCHFTDNQLVQVDVNGNGQTVFYPEDEGEIVAVNIANCSNLKILLDSSKVKTITFYVSPTGGMYPLGQAPKNKLILKGFDWQEAIRPKSPHDIF